jgi:hypothetical protein
VRLGYGRTMNRALRVPLGPLQVELVARPYAFIKFDKNIKKKAKDYANPSRHNSA